MCIFIWDGEEEKHGYISIFFLLQTDSVSCIDHHQRGRRLPACSQLSRCHHSTISPSFAWAEGSSHKTHFGARFPSLSHLSLQDYYTSLILASPLLLNKAPGEALWAHGLMATYTSPIKPLLFRSLIHHAARNGLLIFIMRRTYTMPSGVMYSAEHKNYTHCGT